MQKIYRASVVYFLLFSILLLLSSVMIFEHKIGFSANDITKYYLGDEECYIVSKTYMGVLKVILPHILTIALFGMVLLHFMVFTKYKHYTNTLTYLFFTLLFFELFSPFAILTGLEFFSLVKLVTFIALEIIILLIMGILFKSIIEN